MRKETKIGVSCTIIDFNESKKGKTNIFPLFPFLSSLITYNIRNGAIAVKVLSCHAIQYAVNLNDQVHEPNFHRKLFFTHYI
jgi:hypothetical protein